MGKIGWRCNLAVLAALLGLCAAATGAEDQADSKYTQAAAERMIAAAEGGLAPVYAPLAQEITERFDLNDKEGVGIDLGSGPGKLILELCRRTKLHWINADINAHFFPYFMRKAEEADLSGRVSAVRADAQFLPFRNDYAEVVVSRGSFQFWPDKVRAFAEVLRVLKPGGVAYIGRGLPGNMPLEEGGQLRRRHGSGPKYDVNETEKELRTVMTKLSIADYTIRRPRAGNAAGVNYGIWLEFRKPRQ